MNAFAFRMHLLSPTKAGSDLVGAYKRAPTITEYSNRKKHHLANARKTVLGKLDWREAKPQLIML